MKAFKSLILGAILAIAFTSCDDWLDVNTDPNSPSAESVEYQTLLPWIQFYMSHDYTNTGSNCCMYAGNYIRTGNARERGAATWDLSSSTRANNCYQWFFVGVGPNLGNLYDKAMADGAYHYAGAARLFKAYGFMLMTDIFGEVPYTEALGDIDFPKFDTGKTIFMGCLDDLEEAIELLSMDQEDGAVSLAEGDSWNGGDVDKWIKWAYLLKARWLNHLSKKESGSYTDGKYDASAILEALSYAPQSNSDNTYIPHTDTNGSTHDVLGWDETVDYNTLFSTVGMNSNFYITNLLYENLTNFDGKGIEDPRADRFIPWVRSVKSESTPAEIKWSEDGLWRRSMGFDIQNTYVSSSSPMATSWDSDNNCWYNNTTSEERQGDTIYVQMRSSSKGYNSGADILYRMSSGNDATAMSSVFQVHADTPTYVASYWEACFIKAEVLFLQGDKSGALTALKNGVRAYMDAINDQLETWVAGDASLASVPSYVPMDEDDIDYFIENALGTSSDLTLGKIMTQKMISELFLVESWNDFRRYDFDSEIFFNFGKSYNYKTDPTLLTYCPEGKGPRRWKIATYDQNYNTDNLVAIGDEIPGASELAGVSSGTAWYASDEICTLNIWWDSDQE